MRCDCLPLFHFPEVPVSLFIHLFHLRNHTITFLSVSKRISDTEILQERNPLSSSWKEEEEKKKKTRGFQDLSIVQIEGGGKEGRETQILCKRIEEETRRFNCVPLLFDLSITLETFFLPSCFCSLFAPSRFRNRWTAWKKKKVFGWRPHSALLQFCSLCVKYTFRMFRSSRNSSVPENCSWWERQTGSICWCWCLLFHLAFGSETFITD